MSSLKSAPSRTSLIVEPNSLFMLDALYCLESKVYQVSNITAGKVNLVQQQVCAYGVFTHEVYTVVLAL